MYNQLYWHPLERILPGLASGVLLPILLMGTLLSIPTDCQCGASVPHTHSIFTVSDHRHDAHNGAHQSMAGTHDHDHAAECSQAEPFAHQDPEPDNGFIPVTNPVIDLSQYELVDGPTSRGSGGSGQPVPILASLPPMLMVTGGSAAPCSFDELLTGIATQPESPPPQPFHRV